ncbi:MAG: hypothetical protein ACJ77K_02160 [Bacteroidia bacterium]
MKNSLFILMLFLLSCSPEKKEQGSAAEMAVPIVDEEFDSIRINNVTYKLDPITAAEFFSVKAERGEISDQELIDDSANVKRDGNKITFHLENGKDTMIVNDSSEEDLAYFSYEKDMKDIGYWLLFVSYYEGSSFLVISKADGAQTYMWGYPLVSPDKKHVLSASFDLEAAFCENGIQLFTLSDVRLTHNFDKEIPAWGPSDVRWKDNSSIYIEQSYRKETDPEFSKKYKRMKVIQ